MNDVKKENVIDDKNSVFEKMTTRLKILIADNKSQFKNILILLIVSILINSYLSYKSYSENVKTNKEMAFKIDEAMDVYEISRKNQEVFEHRLCAECHLKVGMYLPKTTGLDFLEFKDYVRGNSRFVKNDVMPKFAEKEISDEDLLNIWKKLY